MLSQTSRAFRAEDLTYFAWARTTGRATGRSATSRRRVGRSALAGASGSRPCVSVAAGVPASARPRPRGSLVGSFLVGRRRGLLGFCLGDSLVGLRRRLPATASSASAGSSTGASASAPAPRLQLLRLGPALGARPSASRRPPRAQLSAPRRPPRTRRRPPRQPLPQPHLLGGLLKILVVGFRAHRFLPVAACPR